jgi:hypothetical protein
MATSRPPRRRAEAPSVAPTSITECARRYHAAAAALAKSFGLPMTTAFLQEYHSAISCVYIEASKAGVRLPPAVQLPPLVVDASVVSTHGPVHVREPMGSLAQPGDTISTMTPDPVVPMVTNSNGMVTNSNSMVTNSNSMVTNSNSMVTNSNGDAPPPPLTAAALPTRIPAGLQLPCAEALIADLRPAQLALLIGKVGLKSMVDKTLEPLHVALLAERARRFEAGKRAEASANGA